MPKHRRAARGYPDAGQGIGIHFVELYQTLAFLVLHISTRLIDIGAGDE